MAYFNGESKLYNCLGCFSTTAQVIASMVNTGTPGDYIDYSAGSNLNGILPGQCQAFLTTSLEFLWFIEQRNIEYKTPESPVNSPPVVFGSKKVYPAKVVGLDLPLVGTTLYGNSPVTVRWRDELIRYGSLASFHDSQSGNFRPGFGELIFADLQRPLKSAVVQPRNLGLPSLNIIGSSPIANGFTGPLGRLMSIASYVNPELAKQYDESKSKKKKKSLNEQTYQDPPVYPAYTQHQSSGGYGG